MARRTRKTASTVSRVFADASGKVFLTNQAGTSRVEVVRPVTEKTLRSARTRLLREQVDARESRQSKMAEELTPERVAANKEIAETIDPLGSGRWLKKFDYGTTYFQTRLLTILGSLMLISASFTGVRYSSEHFPEWLHFIVLTIFVLGLAYLLYLIGTEENRERYHERVKFLFGPRGMLVLPLVLIGTAGGVLASIIFRLYNKGLIQLEMCSGRAVTEAGLMDFSMWHFLNIVPLLQLNSVLRWGEPYCYRQGRVGFLILIFQALVIIPSFNTIRFYWKHKTPAEYTFDPYWNPDPK